MKVIAFKIFGDFAHFRKFYTTSSPLTFPFPPPTAVRGILGAILGFGKEEYIEKTRDFWIGVKINRPVKKIRLGLNLIFTKGSSGKFDPTLIPSRKGDVNKTLRTQIKAELVKEPSYTLYVYSDTYFKELYTHLSEKKTHYTLCLGLSELIANFEFEGIYTAKKIGFSSSVSSVVPVGKLVDIDIERIQRLGKERIPVYMNQERRVLKYEDVIYSLEGKPLYGTVKDLFELENGEVIHLWEPAIA